MKLEQARKIMEEYTSSAGEVSLGIPLFYGIVGDGAAILGAAVKSYVEPRSLGEPIDYLLLAGAYVAYVGGAALVGLGVYGIRRAGRIRQAGEVTYQDYQRRVN